jgi:hypothetical protein
MSASRNGQIARLKILAPMNHVIRNIMLVSDQQCDHHDNGEHYRSADQFGHGKRKEP